MKNMKFARSLAFAVAVAASAVGAAAHAEDLTKTISFSDIESTTYLNYAGNTVLEVDLGSMAHVNTFSWDVTLTAFQGSFISEAFVQLSDSVQFNRLFFLPSEIANPGNGYHAGTEHFSGSVDFRAVDEPGWGIVDLSFDVGRDGILRLEFAENMDDLPGADALWESGSFTVGYAVAAVPEPSSVAMLLLGLGAIGAGARRRHGRAPS